MNIEPDERCRHEPLVACYLRTFPDKNSEIKLISVYFLQVMQCGVPIARMELLDPGSIEACNVYSKMNLETKPTLFFEFHGSDRGITEQAETVGELAEEMGGSGFTFAKVCSHFIPFQ